VGWRLREVTGFLALAIVATWPLALHFTTHAPGGDWHGRIPSFETPINLWNLWWFRYALVDLGQSPFQCGYVFHPYGADLWFHTMSPLPALVGTVLQTFVGLVTTHNLLVLASFVTAGVAASAVSTYCGLGRAASFFAGAVYAFAPVVIRHLYVGHFELLWTGLMPAALLCFLRVVDLARGHDYRRAVLLGLVIAAAAYTSAYYAVYSAELIVVAALVRWRDVGNVRVLRHLGVAACVLALAAGPLVAHFVGAGADLATPAQIDRDFRLYGLEPASFIAPSFAHPILGPWSGPLNLVFSRGAARPQETTGTLGLTVLGLALAAVVWRRRGQGRPAIAAPAWRLSLAVAGVFLVLSLGADLRFLGRPTRVPAPAALLANVPILQHARAPGRHVIVAMLGVSIVAAAGWQAIRRRRWKLAVLAAVAFEFWPAPIPLFSTALPEVYARIAREPGDFAVMDVPVGVRDGSQILGQPDSTHVLAQTVHHRRIVAGMVSRLPRDRWAALRAAPLIGTLLDPKRVGLSPLENAQAYFDEWAIRALVIHPQASAADRQLIESALTITRRESFKDGTELWWVR
jgi:hypothetical protein